MRTGSWLAELPEKSCTQIQPYDSNQSLTQLHPTHLHLVLRSTELFAVTKMELRVFSSFLILFFTPAKMTCTLLLPGLEAVVSFVQQLVQQDRRPPQPSKASNIMVCSLSPQFL